MKQFKRKFNNIIRILFGLSFPNESLDRGINTNKVVPINSMAIVTGGRAFYREFHRISNFTTGTSVTIFKDKYKYLTGVKVRVLTNDYYGYFDIEDMSDLEFPDLQVEVDGDDNIYAINRRYIKLLGN